MSPSLDPYAEERRLLMDAAERISASISAEYIPMIQAAGDDLRRASDLCRLHAAEIDAATRPIVRRLMLLPPPPLIVHIGADEADKFGLWP